MPLPPPSLPSDCITLDCVTDLPEKTACRYREILAVIDRVMKVAIFLPCRKDIVSQELM